MGAAQQTMAMVRCERLLLLVHAPSAPTEAEWQHWIALCCEHPGPIRVLVETHGGGPDAKQRKALSAALQGRELRSAILTDSLVVRGIVTALAWLGITLRAFPLHEIQAAASFLELTAAEVSLAREILPRLRAECGMAELRRAL